MNEFSDPQRTPSQKPGFPPPPGDFLGVPKQIWLIVGVLVILLTIAVLGYVALSKTSELANLRAQAMAQAQAAGEEKRAVAARAQAEINALNDKLSQSAATVADLQKEKEAAIQNRKSLEDEMRAALESRDVTISKLQGKLTVNILDKVLFESGEAVLKPDGEAVLRKVAAILNQHPTLQVHVVGHTDNVPIHQRFASNWELSVARAIAAVRFLSEKAGVNPRQLGAVGYGEYRPIDSNSTPEGRAKNRRIAITVLSEEMAGSDTAVTNTVPLTPSVAVPPPATLTHAPDSPVDTNSPED